MTGLPILPEAWPAGFVRAATRGDVAVDLTWEERQPDEARLPLAPGGLLRVCLANEIKQSPGEVG